MFVIEYNYVLVTAVLAWFSAQVIKTIINVAKTKKFNAERLIGSGGMPSSHSSLVCSATVAVCRQCGAGSPEFALMFIIAMIVMYDAMGVRRAAGMHAHVLNSMIKSFTVKGISFAGEEEKRKEKQRKQKELKEYLGHTPFEVLGGAILGVLMAFVVPININ